jgi:hypothetical protein
LKEKTNKTLSNTKEKEKERHKEKRLDDKKEKTT